LRTFWVISAIPPARGAGANTAGANRVARGTDERLEMAAAQVKATDHAVQVRTAGELAHVPQGVHYAGVAATGEYHEPFASDVGDQRA
jgi:hypothetical protein